MQNHHLFCIENTFCTNMFSIQYTFLHKSVAYVKHFFEIHIQIQSERHTPLALLFIQAHRQLPIANNQ